MRVMSVRFQKVGWRIRRVVSGVDEVREVCSVRKSSCAQKSRMHAQPKNRCVISNVLW
jgi:hypothetical protein